MKTANGVSKQERVRLYIALQLHPAYDRLTEQQQEVIDCFAAGMGYEETGTVMGNRRSAPYSMLKTILKRYRHNIWKITNSVPAAVKLLAGEVELP